MRQLLWLCGAITLINISAPAQSLDREDIRRTLACGFVSSWSTEITGVVVSEGLLSYSAIQMKRSKDEVTSIMLFGRTTALLIEVLISEQKIAVVNLARFRRDHGAWELDETHAGPDNYRRVRALAVRLTKQKQFRLKRSDIGSPITKCTGMGF